MSTPRDEEDGEHYIVPPEDELRRLREGPTPGAQPNGTFLDRILAHGPGNADIILNHCREILDAILAHATDPDLSIAEWRKILPTWFVDQCQEEPRGERPQTMRDQAWQIFERQRSIKSALAYIREHRQEFAELKAEELAHRDDPWTLSAWIFWFAPQERWWWWWDAAIPDSNTLIVTVEASDYQYPAGALLWLLRAAGATSADKEG